MRKKLLLLLTACVCTVQLFAQVRTITGKIFDEAGVPIPGASVKVKGQDNVGTSANERGEYSLQVPASAKVLTYSSVGHKSEEATIGNRTLILMALSPNTDKLADVMVIGYGVTKREAFTGSVATIKSDKIAAARATSFDKALQGNAAGVLSSSNSGQPGGGQKVIIRGVGSIAAGTDPLYIVDGVPVASGNYGNMTYTSPSSATSDNLNVLSSINPNDIESVTILKDASATSIYGARASNGVILITTKHGKAGKLQMSINASTGFSNRTSHNFETLNKDEYIDFLTKAYVNAGGSAATTTVAGKQVNAFIANTFKMRTAEGDFYDFNWIDHAYNDHANTNSADINLLGGNDKTKFFLSASYFDQKGIVINTYMKRAAVRLNLDHKVNDKFQFSENLSLSYTKQRSPYTTSSYFINPVFASGFYAPIDPGLLRDGSPNIDSLTTYSNANFLTNAAYDDYNSQNYRVLGNASAQWNINKNLILKSMIGMDVFFLPEYQWSDPRPKGNSATYGRGTSETSMTSSVMWNETTTLSYTKSFGAHNLNLMLGQEVQASDVRTADAIAQDFPGIDMHEMTSGATPYLTSGTRTQNALNSFFASANYDFNKKYNFSASVRNDASSKFTKNQNAQFWSVGALWKIGKEDFMKNVDWVNSLQLRTSYGTSGNSSGIGNYAARGLYSGGYNYNGQPGVAPYQIKNDDLKWEKNANFNIGVDFAVLDSRIRGTVEYYNKTTKDLLLNTSLSSVSGFTSILSNIGSMRNSGVEVTLNTTPVKTKAFTWFFDINASANKNKILKLYNGQDIFNPAISTNIYREGEDIQSFYLRPWAGVSTADGRAMYYDQKGEIIYKVDQAGDNRKIAGSAAPKVFGGITNTFQYKNWELSAMLYYTIGNKVLDASYLTFTSMGYRGLYNQDKSILTESWQKPGDIASLPKPVYGYASNVYGGFTTDKILFDGSYLRLRDLTISYNLPKNWLSAIKVEGCKIYVQGSNLFTVSKFPDADPEAGASGYYAYGYPMMRTFVLGANLKF